MTLTEQEKKLHHFLSGYGQVGIAFSGGVDSSFLLKSALDVLGGENVVVLFARSCLQTKEEQHRALTWLARHGFSRTVRLLTFNLKPLSWPEMATNPEDRCYQCKRRLYALFFQELARMNIPFLLDGTNADDVHQHRPGLLAIRELGVRTPLLDADLDKNKIRDLSRQLGLDTFDQPSSSCLATRIPHGLVITRKRLEKIRQWEEGMAQLGFFGCRVRMDRFSKRVVSLQVLRKDLTRLSKPEMMRVVKDFFSVHAIEHVHINPNGR
ncbi:MAG: TIGR00268 family protein [Desulfobulbus sp.]|nr:MAG: TIGR00268 family protein [Desulfobulbus sp.]